MNLHEISIHPDEVLLGRIKPNFLHSFPRGAIRRRDTAPDPPHVDWPIEYKINTTQLNWTPMSRIDANDWTSA